MGIRNRFNDPTFIAGCVVLTVALVLPTLLMVRHGSTDVLGFAAFALWVGLVVRVFRGLVYPGDWHPGDGDDD